MKKKSMLFSAIAMLLVSVIAITGSTFAWFTSSRDARVHELSAGVTGSGTLSISERRDTTFRSSVTAAEIYAENTHMTAADEYTAVTPKAGRDSAISSTYKKVLSSSTLANAIGTGLTSGNDQQDGIVEFVGGMTQGTYTYDETADLAAFDVANGNTGFDGTDNTDPLYADWLVYRDAAKDAAETAFYNDPDNYSYGANSKSLIYFSLYFKATVEMDIFLQLPTTATGKDRSYFRSDNAGNTTAQTYLDRSLRAGFVASDVTETETVGEPVTLDDTPMLIYNPMDASVAPPSTYQGDLLGTKGGGHIVTDLYKDITWTETAAYLAAGATGGVSYTDAVAGNYDGVTNELRVGRCPAYDGTDATVTQIHIYIWIDGNDLYNTSYIAGGKFSSHLLFYGRTPAEVADVATLPPTP